jgi:hypothetical protein
MPTPPVLVVCIVCQQTPPDDVGWTLYRECTHVVCARCEGRPGRRAVREQCPVCTGETRR